MRMFSIVVASADGVQDYIVRAPSAIAARATLRQRVNFDAEFLSTREIF